SNPGQSLPHSGHYSGGDFFTVDLLEEKISIQTSFRKDCLTPVAAITAQDVLRRGLDELGLELCDVQLGQLLRYLELLQQWNKAYNLTAITDQLDMVRLQLLDSLAILPFLR